VLAVLWILTAIGMFGTVVPSVLVWHATIVITEDPTLSWGEQVLNEFMSSFGPTEVLLVAFLLGFITCAYLSRDRQAVTKAT
jgi:hypothetical protein